MKITKVRDVKTPSRGTPGSAGIDFFIPNDMAWDHITLHHGESINIPSGIIAEVPEHHMLCAFNKSGISIKKGLQVVACVVDSDYRGEIHLHVCNISYNSATIKRGEKLVQFVLLPVIPCSIEVVYKEEIDMNTSRGTGAFGSTGEN